MKNLLKILAVLLVAISYNAKAQQVVKKDTINGTELTVTMDEKVNGIIEGMENNCSKNNSFSENNSDSSTPKSTPTKVTVPTKAPTNVDICRQNPKVLGYKIQLVVVKSNEEANQVKAFFRNRFPTIKAETDASLRPNYKVLAGSYFTKESAASDLKKIKQYFKTAIPVQYRVFCVEAK